MLAILFVPSPSVVSQIRLEVFADGFSRPVALASAGDSRMFVVEQEGRIMVVDSSGNTHPEPFLDIAGQITAVGNEQGLLGLAFHPDYATNGFFYVNYTDVNGNTRVSRFSVSGTNPGQADQESEFPIISFEQPFMNHNGGDLKFGPDGYLYISTGDGGSGGDPGNRAQDLATLLGKILRIDVDGGSPYAVPADNPFAGIDSVMKEIWALGLRNPWRISFDRETGDLWIADVGQREVEEINFQPAASAGGENYGWRCYEGSNPYNTEDCLENGNYIFPVHEYTHDPGGFCSVTGGYVYRGLQYPSLRGHYFFADYCRNRIWSLQDHSGTWAVTDHGQFQDNTFSTFGEDRNGELYVAALSGGTLYRITAAETAFPAPDRTGPVLRVYPNPVTDRMWIEYRGILEPDTQISLYTPEGKLLISGDTGGNPRELNLEHLSPGIYILGIRLSDGMHFHRIVKH